MYRCKCIDRCICEHICTHTVSIQEAVAHLQKDYMLVRTELTWKHICQSQQDVMASSYV